MQKLDLEGILKRLRIVTNTKSNHAMCLKLGYVGATSGNWIKRQTIPYEACFRASQLTGKSIDWLLTGINEEEKATKVDMEKLIADFSEIIADGIELGFISTTDETNKETIELLGKKLYRKHTRAITDTLVKRNSF